MSNKRTHYLVSFGYEGGSYYGLAPQAQLPTAALDLKKRLLMAGFDPKGLAFTSRTDRGVHALQNVASFWSRQPDQTHAIAEQRLATLAAQQKFQDHLFSVQLCKVPKTAHARAITKAKRYLYWIHSPLQPVATPVHTQPTLGFHIALPLDVAAMHAAAQHLVGTHDFASFKGPGKAAQSTIRHIDAINVYRRQQWVVVDVLGQSFLRYMVRIIVGSLLEVGVGQRDAGDLKTILAACNRRAAGFRAPAHGLVLAALYNAYFSVPDVPCVLKSHFGLDVAIPVITSSAQKPRPEMHKPNPYH